VNGPALPPLVLPAVPAPAGIDVGALPALPAVAAAAGDRAALRYVEFFTVQIRNPNTRAAYVEAMGRELSAPTVKQQLAAIRVLFDWLVVGQVVPHNPAAFVRGRATV
jgi:site-specific recombinase XerC